MAGWRHRSSAAGLVALAVGALTLAGGAAAHGPEGGGVGYVSSISGLRPPVLGAIVTVLGGDDRLQLVNYTGKTIVVDGYQGEPFLRFTPDGVYENTRSPATYESLVRDPKQADVPATADPQAPPRWTKVSEGSTFAWHDHRIHWTGRELPAVIRDAPHETHLIFRWAVPARVAAKRFAITGFLGYRPPPEAPGGGRDWLVYPVALGAAVLAALGFGAVARRRGRRRAT